MNGTEETGGEYVIQWKSKDDARIGRGPKRFGKEEAERLAEELNQEYPQMEHTAVLASSDMPSFQ